MRPITEVDNRMHARALLREHYEVLQINRILWNEIRSGQGVTGEATDMGDEEQHRLIFDTMPDAFVVVDADGMITEWNTQAERIFGWSREEAVGRRASDTIITRPPKYRGEHEHEGRDFPATSGNRGLNRWIERMALHRDGRELPVEVLVAPVRLGQTWSRTMFVHDITERIRAEEAFRATRAELARANRVMMMGEVTGSIAHEINQPLAAIVTYANACTRMLAGPSPDLNEIGEGVKNIAEAGTKASQVISRIRAVLSRHMVEKTHVDINELIREAPLLLTRGELHNHQISVQTELLPGLPSVLADRVGLQQVILNLIMNGIDAMAAVTDRPRVLVIRSQVHESGSVLVAVKDSGMGIDPGDTEGIFAPFFTTKPNGMGMGLSISRSIVEAHGGRLWATPNDDQGATFQFTLPASNDRAP